MPALLDAPDQSSNAVPFDVSQGQYRPTIRDDIVATKVIEALLNLGANCVDVVEEGGLVTSRPTIDFLARLTSEIVFKALLNPKYSVEDFKMTPFARTDGGAHLLVDLAPTGKRLSFRISPDGTSAWVAMTDPKETVPGTEIQQPDQIGIPFAWLTKAA